MTDITVFNTPSRAKKVFAPLKEGEVRIYHCGPTVYHFQHIGNMRRFIFADLVHRLFLAHHYNVQQIINITDVGHLVSDQNDGEDKMEKGAKREGKTAQEIAAMYTADFMEDLKLLKISTEDTRFPKATEHIPEQIAMIQSLEEKGFTYQITDGIYFDTSKDEHYPDFAHLDLEGMKEGARVEKNDEKRNPTDFALWKFSPANEQRQQEWQSPWGAGFPGWHIECSAMAKAYLGTTIDIHTGGIDHVPVHHTNEVAQSENANEAPFARYWMHNEHVDFGGSKMAKSGDSFVRLKDLVARGYHPLAYRYYTLLAHYRTKINFSFEALDAATVAWKRLNDTFAKLKDVTASDRKPEQFLTALSDDLDTPRVIAGLWEMLKAHPGDMSDADKKAALMYADSLLGILDPAYQSEHASLNLDELPDDIKALIVERQTARTSKNWVEADRLRDLLAEKGYVIKDSSEGVVITKR